MDFKYYQPTKIIFGQKKSEELKNLLKGSGKNVILLGPKINKDIEFLFKKIEKYLDESGVKYIKYYDIEPNPSVKTADKVISLILENNINQIVAVGGGSVLDVAKIVSVTYNKKINDWDLYFNEFSDFKKDYPSIVENKIPVIAIPTTSGTGSQCTHACVLTSIDNMKLTIFHKDVFIEQAILDPELTLSLPNRLTASTAFDAFSHLLESYLREENPICNILSKEGIKNIFEFLPKVLKDNRIEYREKLMISDTLGGISLTNCGVMLPHPLSEIIGSFINISHGEALAIVYKKFIECTLIKYEKQYASLARFIDCNLNDKNDKECAYSFYLMLKNMMDECDLNKCIRDYCDDENLLLEIYNLIDSIDLPMESYEIKKLIIDDLFK